VGKIKHQKGQVVATKDVGFSSFNEGLGENNPPNPEKDR